MAKHLNVKLNDEEEEELEALKLFLNLKGVFGEDSVAVKTGVRVALNVLRSVFGKDLSEVFKRGQQLAPTKNFKQYKDKLAKK